jgi:nucleotide-binding universal stress UspA family protein
MLGEKGRIVVGIDGSDSSKHALRWAIAEAELRDSEVVALHAWHYPAMVAPVEAVVPPPPEVDFKKDAEELVRQVIAEVAGDPDVEVRGEVVQMSPAYALVRASADADLLVIGSRGYGGFRGLLLGSVGHQCALHAACPVVILPHEEHPEEN